MFSVLWRHALKTAEFSGRFQVDCSKTISITQPTSHWEFSPFFESFYSSKTVPFIASVYPIHFLPSKHQSLKIMTLKWVSTWKLCNVAKSAWQWINRYGVRPWSFGFLKATELRSEVHKAGLSLQYVLISKGRWVSFLRCSQVPSHGYLSYWHFSGGLSLIIYWTNIYRSLIKYEALC